MERRQMPQTCTVCRHTARLDIERALISGKPLRDIAGRYHLSKTAVARHKDHILAESKLNSNAQEKLRTTTIMADIEAARERSEQLYLRVENLLNDALAKNDGRMAIQVIRTGIDIL